MIIKVWNKELSLCFFLEKKITLLEEFKKSLIHHVVTGKVDMRGGGKA